MKNLLQRRGSSKAPERQAAVAPAEVKSAWDLAEGDQIAPGLTALRMLGGGERYEAYVAWDERLLSLVVAKLLRPGRVGDQRARDAMAAEAAMLRRLRHPVIVRAFDVVTDGERPHLVLEHVNGPRLSTLIRTSAIALDQTLSLGLQLTAAAHYMSTRDVVHLDIKPQNIIMSGPARLIDLSVAKRGEELAGVTAPIGTTKYMAPEQADPARSHELGPAADVWGIGVTLYWMLAKGSPFPQPSGDERAPLELHYPQLGHEPAALPASTPPELAELIDAMLAPRAAERPTAAEVHEALEPLAAALPRPQLSRFRVPRKK